MTGRRTALVGPLLLAALAALLFLVVPAPAAHGAPVGAVVTAAPAVSVGAIVRPVDGLPLPDDLDAPGSAWPAPVAPSTSGNRALSEARVIPIIFPLEKKWPWEDTYGAARSGGRSHEGNDIMVPKMTKLLAVVDGTLDLMNFSGKTSSYNGLPYYNLLLRGDDGNDYYYIHLNNDTPGTDDAKGGVQNAYAPGLTDGSRVKQGQFIGYAGDSGNAEDSGSHLHFEIHSGGYKNPISPYASLKAAPTYAEWLEDHGTPPPPPPPPEMPFTDATPGAWFYADLLLLYKADVVAGGTETTFRPYDQVTRAHFAAFLVRAFRAGELKTPAPTTSPFPDVPTTFWGYSEVTTAARLGLVKGVGDGTRFAPDASITRAQMAVMIARALGLLSAEAEQGEVRPFPDIPQDYWAALEIAAVRGLDLVKGLDDGDFHPEMTASRAQSVAVIARAVRLDGGGS
jgi:murein DD-endopeptidase MepM/ murein hydrolase activator NlpD